MEFLKNSNAVAISNVGNSRKNNEDNYFLPCFDNNAFCINQNAEMVCNSNTVLPERFCCAVSDGMGGYEFGEVAAMKVVRYFADNYDELMMCSERKELIVDYITKLNDRFCDFAVQNKAFSDMGATLCGVLVNGVKAFCFNVGDSRAYTLSSGKLKQITVDHSEGQRLLDLQLLTADEVKMFPQRKSIYKYVGQKTKLISDVFEIENFNECSHILLCTDGLTDVLSDKEIENVLNSSDTDIKNKGQFLVELALERRLNRGDNITLVLIKLWGRGK